MQPASDSLHGQLVAFLLLYTATQDAVKWLYRGRVSTQQGLPTRVHVLCSSKTWRRSLSLCVASTYLGCRELGSQKPLKSISINQAAEDSDPFLLGCLLPVFHPLHKPLLLLTAQQKELCGKSLIRKELLIDAKMA